MTTHVIPAVTPPFSSRAEAVRAALFAAAIRLATATLGELRAVTPSPPYDSAIRARALCGRLLRQEGRQRVTDFHCVRTAI